MKYRGRCEYELPSSLVCVIKSVCSDYYRRATAIKNGTASGVVLDEYLRLNIAVETALEDIEKGIRGELLHDVALGLGYNKSVISVFMAKNTYYQRRRKLIYDIAKALNLA